MHHLLYTYLIYNNAAAVSSLFLLPTINAYTVQFGVSIQSVSIIIKSKNRNLKKTMVSIKVQVIFGLLVFIAYSELFADGIRFSMPRGRIGSGSKGRKNPFLSKRQPSIQRIRSSSSSTQIQRTNSGASLTSIENNPEIRAPLAPVETQKKSNVKAVIATEVSKSLALGGTLVGANTFSSWTDSKIRQSVDAETEEMRQERAKIDCTSNEYGCLNGMCWTNCGPRLDKGDWCYTTKNITAVPRKSTNCFINTDCNPCWSCAGVCTDSIQ